MLTFQQIILKLQSYLADQGCALTVYDMEVGAASSHCLRALGPRAMESGRRSCRCPKDGRYGETRTACTITSTRWCLPAPSNILSCTSAAWKRWV
jgi:glycyl-tRNA synthetase alpha chain